MKPTPPLADIDGNDVMIFPSIAEFVDYTEPIDAERAVSKSFDSEGRKILLGVAKGSGKVVLAGVEEAPQEAEAARQTILSAMRSAFSLPPGDKLEQAPIGEVMRAFLVLADRQRRRGIVAVARRAIDRLR